MTNIGDIKTVLGSMLINGASSTKKGVEATSKMFQKY